MPTLSEELVLQLMQLSEADRGELADRLIDSLHREPDGSSPEAVKAAWVTECRRRLDELDAGLPSIPLEDAWPRIAGRHVR